LSREEAQYAAKRAFGNRSLTKENVRAAWGGAFLETIAQYLRYGFRSLRASPVFALVAISSLGLGIGANTAIFSFMNALLLKQLPVPEPAQLVQVAGFAAGKEVNTNFTFPFLAELDRRSQTFDGVLGRFPVRVNFTTQSGGEPLSGELVTGNYFTTLQIKPALGRLLTNDDINTAAGNPQCVISYSLWQRRFAADPHILGRKLLLNAHSYTVVGVTQEGFYGSELQSRVDLQMPVSRLADFMGAMFMVFPDAWKSPNFTWLYPLARLKTGVPRVEAQAKLDPLAHAIRLELTDPKGRQDAAAQKITFRLTEGSQGSNTKRPIPSRSRF
jgi:hypothetical protein